MLIRRRFLVSAAAFTLASCADAPGPAEPPLPSLNLGGPQRHVVGSGHVQQAAGLREFTFHAVAQPNGNVAGSFKVILPSGLFFEADVTCLAVSGNTAWVGGTIRATNAAAVVIGSTSTFYAIDNGEGDAAPADVVSTAAFNGAAGADLAFCANQPLVLPPLTVAEGNVQVR